MSMIDDLEEEEEEKHTAGGPVPQEDENSDTDDAILKCMWACIRDSEQTFAVTTLPEHNRRTSAKQTNWWRVF